MSEGVWLTPSIIIGRVPFKTYRTRPVGTVEQALEAAEAGYVAVLPAGAWEVATRLLMALGLDRHTAEDRIRVARSEG